MKALKLIVSACALTMATASHAGLVGKTFDTYYAFPDIDTPYGFATATPATFVVGAGVETTFEVEDVTSISADFSDSALTLVLNTSLNQPTWNATSFNGLVFDLAAGGPLDIVSAAVDPGTTMAGFDASRVVFDAGRIGINWAGLSYVDGTTVTVNFTSAVPEPSTWALFVLGGILMLAARREPPRRAAVSHQPPTA